MRSPESIRKEVNDYSDKIDQGKLKPLPGGLKGKLVSELNRVFGGSQNRYYVMGWLFTGSFDKPMQSKDLTDAQLAGLLHWIELKHVKGGWSVGRAFYAEATLMYAYVVKGHLSAREALPTLGMEIAQSLYEAIK